MSGATAPALLLVEHGPTPPDGRVARLRTLLRPAFLAEVWDGAGEVFAPPRTHPLLGLRKCAVIDCEAGVRTPNTDLCKLCIENFKASGLTMPQFTAAPTNKITKGERWCRVPGCQRPSHLRARLCASHYTPWRASGLTAQDYAASPAARPLATFGPCTVTSCSRTAAGTGRLCAPHRQRWSAAQRQDPRTGFQRWLRTAEPINVDHQVIFKRLAEQVQLELLLGLQQRTAAGVRTLVTALRPVVAVLRASEAAGLDDLDDDLIKPTRHDAAVLARALRLGVSRAMASPEQERRSDVWDLAVFGLSGRIPFTTISQDWLRETAKLWAEEELPRHRGRQAANTVKTTVAAIGQLSGSLHLSRPDHGDLMQELGRRDLVTYTNRLAHQQRTGEITEAMRLRSCRAVRRFLLDIRALGLTRHGGLASGLPDDFILNRHDMPPEPDRVEAGRDLPSWVLRILDANLHVLADRSGLDMRRMVELLIDTGRRPDEICQLRSDCLARDAHGKPVLIYTDSKNHKPGRRLPVAEATARVVADQQDEVRQRFPDTPPGDLPLFPRDRTNPSGRHTYTEAVFSNTHRRWVDTIAGLLVTTVTGPDGRRGSTGWR